MAEDLIESELRACLSRAAGGPPPSRDLIAGAYRGRTRRRVAIASLSAAAVAAIAVPAALAISRQSSPAAQFSAGPVAGHGPVITIPLRYQAPAGGMQGAVVLHHGCLLFEGRPALWPEGSRWDPRARQVVLADGSRVSMSQPLFAGGTFLTFEQLRGVASSGAIAKARRCASGVEQAALLVPPFGKG